MILGKYTVLFLNFYSEFTKPICLLLLTGSLTCRLTQSHDGKYLALWLADCLTRFGLNSLVRTLPSYDDDDLSLSSIRLIYYA